MTQADIGQNLKIQGQEFGRVQPLMWQCFFSYVIEIYSEPLDTALHHMARKKNCDKRRQENLPKLPPNARFMDAYHKGLNGPQAVWANRKYHGHWVLPNDIVAIMEAARKA